MRCSRTPMLVRGPKHDPADLPIETRHLRGVSGGEPHRGRINEQMLNPCKRFFEMPCLRRLRHVRCSSQFVALSASCERDGSRRQARRHPAQLVAAAASGAAEVHARLSGLEPAPPGATNEAGDSSRSFRASGSSPPGAQQCQATNSNERVS
jgi:hypothetical protein